MSVIRGQLNALRAADRRISDVRDQGGTWRFEVLDKHGYGDPLMSERLARCLTRDDGQWSVQVLGLNTVEITLASEDVPLSSEFRASLLELRKELATR